MKASEQAIIVEIELGAAPKRVWAAITNPKEMSNWYFEEIEDFEARIGFETHFTVQLEDRKFEHIWKVVEAEPEKRIAYTWKYGNYPGDSILSMGLVVVGQGTRLRLEHRTIEDFPDGIEEFTRESGVAGWKYFIEERLKKYLGG
jgi:uncharacterized protein YndB with AHSA1/START domain